MKIRSLKYLIFEGFKNIWSNRLMSVASISVLVACMLLMGSAVVISLNAEKMLDTLNKQNIVVAFFDFDLSDELVQKGLADIQAIDNVDEVKLVTSKEAIQAAKDGWLQEYADILTYYDDDDLLTDSARISMDSLEHYDETVEAIKRLDNIKTVKDDKDLTRNIYAFQQVAAIAGVSMIIMLLFTALFIIANTIRITMHSRKLEISIMKAVGATNNFIRLPFVVEGISLGIISALFTTGLLYSVYRLILDRFSDYIPSNQVVGFSQIFPTVLSMFIIIGVVTGLVGSMFSLGKYLRKEGSEFRAY